MELAGVAAWLSDPVEDASSADGELDPPQPADRSRAAIAAMAVSSLLIDALLLRHHPLGRHRRIQL
ncbi:hypothetical protein MMEU_0797 [Mycobacterium marinum str. Europe]|nr:hypothetical protein MMEU_0797 [Mycobacterium marinum str. Europe]